MEEVTIGIVTQGIAGLAVIAPATALVALIFAYGLSSWINKTDEGNDRMKEIAGYIREGAMAFLRREYKTMAIVIAALFLILGFGINWITAALYVVGALLSVLAGFFGMRVATKGNVRTASAAQSGGMNRALKVAFRSGAVMGLCVAGLGLLGVGGFFVLLGVDAASVITGFGLGA
ncbi:MAG: sodium/proton-translocating pyrophosphatase, partial [Clostridiales Family XIII bacterium]|nr:sodium/proton-translocating pyrophosphatase [Clostridiales Family XIII bacterium]